MPLQQPRGVIHHYAPLAFIRAGKNNQLQTDPCSCEFEPMSDCFALSSRVTGAHLLKDRTSIATETKEPAQAKNSAAAPAGKEAKPARKRPEKRSPAKRVQ
jgi:hypothetical protein